jgi:hypothetical protein
MSQSKVNSLLILEGLHGTGKSTVAASIMSNTRVASFHAGPPVSDDPYYEYLRPFIFLDGWDVVFDRGHIGELVWPAIFQRPSLFPTVKGVFPQVERAIKEAASVVEIWYLTGSGTSERLGESTKNACEKKGLTPEQIVDAHALYLEALEVSMFDVKFLDFSSIDKEVERWKSL